MDCAILTRAEPVRYVSDNGRFFGNQLRSASFFVDSYARGLMRDRYRESANGKNERLFFSGWAAASYLNLELLYIAEEILKGINECGEVSRGDFDKIHEKLNRGWRLHREIVRRACH